MRDFYASTSSSHKPPKNGCFCTVFLADSTIVGDNGGFLWIFRLQYFDEFYGAINSRNITTFQLSRQLWGEIGGF